MPALSRISAFVFWQVVDISPFFGCRQCRSLTAVETDCDNFKFLTGFKRHDSEGAGHPVQNLITKHRALVVNQRQHDRFRAKVVTQLYDLVSFVAKLERER